MGRKLGINYMIMLPRWHQLSFMVLLLSEMRYTSAAQLSMNFYETTCPNVEEIARNSVRRSIMMNPTAPGALLRLAFHDCQVQKCDASILLDSNRREGIVSERVSGSNFGIRGLDIIDQVKKDLEKACPRTVSCADIVAMAGRDAVAIAGGPVIPIPLGRKDALSGSNLMADAELPPASSSVTRLIDVFAPYDMSLREAVAILGAHTLGVGHCVNVVNRLYPQRDPTLTSTAFYWQLRGLCPTRRPLTNLTIIPNDLTSMTFDNRYFKDVLTGRGLFGVDANLAIDSRTKPILQQFGTDQQSFFDTFVSAYQKMVSNKVLAGTSGEVRINCHLVNQ